MSNNERFTIKTYTNPSGQQVWRVEGRMPDGERVRQNFKQQADALARRAELDIQALNRPLGVGFKQTRLTDEPSPVHRRGSGEEVSCGQGNTKEAPPQDAKRLPEPNLNAGETVS